MPHKGVHLLIKSFREIKSDDIQLKIYGAGPSDFMDQLQSIINLDERISICGEYASDQIGTVFKEIDVLIIPSLCYENYSMVLHEAFESVLKTF